jgi:hypothetical protein
MGAIIFILGKSSSSLSSDASFFASDNIWLNSGKFFVKYKRSETGAWRMYPATCELFLPYLLCR